MRWKRRNVRFDHLLGTNRLASTASTESLPRAVQPSIWDSLVPKFLRASNPRTEAAKRHKQREWSPYTFFVIIFLFIGSNAMNLIALRKEFTAFSRQSEANIALLKEALERVQRGENVDIARLLGTGDKEKEQEWEQGTISRPKFAVTALIRFTQVLREIEQEAQPEIVSEGGRKGSTRASKEAGSQLDAKRTINLGTENIEKTMNKNVPPRPAGFY